MARIGRNQPCPCGSGKKYKKCCYGKNNKGKILFSSGLRKDLPEGTIVTPNTRNEKMSEILLEFAEPLTDECESDRAFFNAIQLSALAWNSSSFPPKERKKLIDGDIEKYIKDNLDKKTVKAILSMMLERKKKSFSHIKMMIVDLEISRKDGQHQLNVMSAPINE
ncbi:MAG: SEC-C metal-binding domain-containing protein [Actinomycetota bacterium]